MRYYSKETGSTYLAAVNGSDMPADAVPIDEDRFNTVIANPVPGKVRSHDADGLPILIDAPLLVPSVDQLCWLIDQAADRAREVVAGDPLRAVEYQNAATEAQTFKAAGYPAEDVPPMVAAWAIGSRTAQQAADNILDEAARYNGALVQIRTVRLAAKEAVRGLMANDRCADAEVVATQTVAGIQATVAGIGNNTGS